MQSSLPTGMGMQAAGQQPTSDLVPVSSVKSVDLPTDGKPAADGDNLLNRAFLSLNHSKGPPMLHMSGWQH